MLIWWKLQQKGSVFFGQWLIAGGPTPCEIARPFQSDPQDRKYYERFHADAKRIKALRENLKVPHKRAVG